MTPHLRMALLCMLLKEKDKIIEQKDEIIEQKDEIIKKVEKELKKGKMRTRNNRVKRYSVDIIIKIFFSFFPVPSDP